MRELLIAVGKTMPLYYLRDELNKALEKYEGDPSQRNVELVGLWLYMLGVRFLTDGKGIDETVAEYADKSEFIKEALKNRSDGSSGKS